jgi:menaquinone-dependent protoporphyrinogen oxidase
MEGKVLVAYASKYGSTKEVAEAVAATLRESGLAVDIQPMRRVRTLEGYRAVVMGAPIYLGSWHGDALDFLARLRETFGQKTVAVFALGPTQGDETERSGSRSQLDTILAKFPWLAPIAIELFAGRYNPAKFNLFDRLITALPASPLHGVPASDHRDWAAIRVWAGGLAAKIRPAVI